MSPCAVEEIVVYSGVRRAPHSADVYLWATSWQGHEWTHGTCCLSAALLIKTQYVLQSGGTGGTAPSHAMCRSVTHNGDVKRQRGYQSIVTINMISYSWELNRLRDNVNLPVGFLQLSPLRLQRRLSVWYLFCLGFFLPPHPVTAESFNWVTTISPPWIITQGSGGLVEGWVRG